MFYDTVRSSKKIYDSLIVFILHFIMGKDHSSFLLPSFNKSIHNDYPYTVETKEYFETSYHMNVFYLYSYTYQLIDNV